MAFASEWLQTGPVFPVLIREDPEKKTGIIVVIPSYNEPEVTTLLNSLSKCRKPENPAEVIIVVNSPPDAGEEVLHNNRHTVTEAELWKKNSGSFFRLYTMNIEKAEIKGWGVGLARKTGMDEALRRFNAIAMGEGVIASLDADCTVDENYFVELERSLLNKKERKACSIYFEHPLAGLPLEREISKAIVQYELHLRYYLQALYYSGYPYAFHTVGSSLAVKASAYVGAGGMNRRQAGEDFYFVQKLVQSGGYFSLNSTIVFPSPRISGRVPFGTGAAIGKMIGERQQVYLTYDPQAFSDLRSLFRMSLNFQPYSGFPPSVRSFMGFDEWHLKMEEIAKNTSGSEAFRKRFFGWFNMFRIVKFLNFSHHEYFRKRPVFMAAAELLRECGKDFPGADATELLYYYRSLERGRV